MITDLAVLGYGEESKRMEILSLHPGVELERVKEATGFELEIREPLTTTAVPSDAELRILRDEVDPYRYIIGRQSGSLNDRAMIPPFGWSTGFSRVKPVLQHLLQIRAS